LSVNSSQLTVKGALPMSTGPETPKNKSKLDSKTVLLKRDQNPSSTKTTEMIEMDKISQTILKSVIEEIQLLTLDNYTLWKNQVKNVLDLQELSDGLTSPNRTLTASQDVQLCTILTAKLDTSVQANMIDHNNQKDARKI
jgi:hypothetical protein